MKTLKEKADKLAMKYINEFEKKYELYLEFAVADDYFNVLYFRNYFVNFNDVKYCVDNNVDSELFFNWYNDNLEFNLEKESDRTFINLPSYIMGLRHKDLK